MVRLDDGGFEEKTLDYLLAQVDRYYPDNSLGRRKNNTDYSFKIDDSATYYLLINRKIGGHETDIAIVDYAVFQYLAKIRSVAGSNLSQRTKGYITTIECKNLGHNIKRHFSLDLLGRNYDLGTNNSIIMKEDNGNRFNWQMNFDITGVSSYNFTPGFASEVIEQLRNKDNKTRFVLESNKYLFKNYTSKVCSEIQRKRNDELRFGINRSSIHLNVMDAIMKDKFAEFPHATGINDLVLDGGAFDFDKRLGFSIPGAVVTKEGLLLSNYTKDPSLSLPDLRQFFGNCVLVNAKGIFYYPQNLTEPTIEFAEKYKNIIRLEKVKEY
ncbi:Uncharacterised protein [Candidatus Tiddalikarchaeum anstoanum]|nr:Uncharacterised protein [Candidatus Tiddalikarchaeum anstoanum]